MSNQANPDRPPVVLETVDLTKSYGPATVVDHLCLEVPEGGIYGFLGPNGAGKSTTMKMLLGLVRPHKGSIKYFDQDFDSCRSVVLPAIGSMIEGPSYYPHLTGRENLALAAASLGVAHSQVEANLETVELTHHADKKARDYSMGMKQRLGIAMALLGDPFLLMLDEPTNGLDPGGVVDMRELIISLAHERHITVLLSSHTLSEIEQMADYVGILAHGQLRYQGRLDGLRAAGTTVFRTSSPHVAQAVLASHGVPAEVRHEQVRAPEVGDRTVAAVVRELIVQGHDVYRVEGRRQSLEEAFMAITEPPVAKESR